MTVGELVFKLNEVANENEAAADWAVEVCVGEDQYPAEDIEVLTGKTDRRCVVIDAG